MPALSRVTLRKIRSTCWWRIIECLGAAFIQSMTVSYYVGDDFDGLPRAFRFYSFGSRKSVDVAPSPTNLSMGLTVTPDRTRLAYSTKSRGSEDLVQIEFQ